MVRPIRDTTTDQDRWRRFFLYDSDRRHPDELLPTWNKDRRCQGYEFEELCLTQSIPPSRHHQLRRRSIENYLPRVALEKFDASRTETLFAIGEMRSFYNMKFGLDGDRASGLDGFWSSLTPEKQRCLETGYGRRVAEAFADLPRDLPWERDIEDEVRSLSNHILDAV